MSDKVEHVLFNRYMREASKRFAPDKYDQETDEMSQEDRLKELQRLKKENQESKVKMDAMIAECTNPELRQRLEQYAKEANEYLNGLCDAIGLDGEFDIKAIKILMERSEEKDKEFLKGHVGLLNRKGEFICSDCLRDKEIARFIKLYGLETIITLYDVTRLKPGSFYQCDNCKKKLSLDEFTD